MSDKKTKILYLIGGTMGVGKTTVCQRLKMDLPNSVFLDGDWCWDANPFQVTEETKLWFWTISAIFSTAFYAVQHMSM